MAKALSLQAIHTNASSFARDWRDAEGYERGEAQTFVRDLLAVFGVTSSRAAVYEMRARRSSTAQQGFIDALVPGLAVIEMKSAGRDLDAAERQALDYLDSLSDAEMPRYVLTSNFKRFRLLDLIEPDTGTFEFSLEELPAQSDRLAFFAGYGLRKFGSASQEKASIKAAQLMGSLWEQLEESGYTDHEASVFMVRTLFALYADDSAVWERDLFLEFLETRTSDDGADLGAQLAVLYQAMSTPIDERFANLDDLAKRFPYVNGDLFTEQLSIAAFSKSMRDTLLDCCAFNWSEISPAIFGSLFQAVKDAAARHDLGEHYTTETNILKVIRPMFLDDLRQRYEESFSDTARLRALRRDMGKMRFLDPAAGCGNFLVISYREMRRLDLEILVRLQELGSRGSEITLMFDADDLPVRLEHFHGIEIEEWPAQIARTALHLAEHQANQAMELALGQGPETLPLNKFDTMYVGNAITTDWWSVVEPSKHLYVLGNPPFLGHAMRTPEQAAELRYVWNRNDVGRLDYVTAWYAKAIQLFARPDFAGEFAFVSTNSITQGEPVPALFGPIFAAGWRVKFAHRTFGWSSEAPGAAAVHCVIVGFDQHPRRPAALYDYDQPKGEPRRVEVLNRINGYLADGEIVFVEQRRQTLSPSLPPLAFGNVPRDGGNLIVEADERALFESDQVAEKYLREFVGARELIDGTKRSCLWLVALDPSDIAHSPLLRDRIDATRAWRLSRSAQQVLDAAATPHLFWHRPHRDVPHLVVPRVSSELRQFIPCGLVPGETIVSDGAFTCEDPEGFAFGVVSSSAFITWQRAVGGRLKSDLRVSNTLTWNTFPLPGSNAEQREAIIAGGIGVLDARARHPDRSLADHYNPRAMDPRLLAAHKALDRSVDGVFGLSGKVDEDARLRAMFASYVGLIGGNQLQLHGRLRR